MGVLQCVHTIKHNESLLKLSNDKDSGATYLLSDS